MNNQHLLKPEKNEKNIQMIRCFHLFWGFPWNPERVMVPTRFRDQRRYINIPRPVPQGGPHRYKRRDMGPL